MMGTFLLLRVIDLSRQALASFLDLLLETRLADSDYSKIPWAIRSRKVLHCERLD